MPEIYVDADACPVKDEILRVAGRHGLKTRMVSDGGIRPSRDPMVDRHRDPGGRRRRRLDRRSHRRP